MKYAYIRKTPKGVLLNKQIQLFIGYGVEKENIFMDLGDATQTCYYELIHSLKKDDLLLIKTLSALGDDYLCIANEWTRIAKVIGADICVVDMPACDTRLGSSREIVTSAVVQMLYFCAERVQRQSALQAKGIRAAKQRGVRFGRPLTKYSDEFISVGQQFKSGKITMKQALVLTGMKQSSFYYHIHQLEKYGYLS